MPPDPTRHLTRLVLAAMLLIAVAVLSRRFLFPPLPRAQCPGGLKQLALPLCQLEALAATIPADAPGSDAGMSDLTRTYLFATLTESEARTLQGKLVRFRVEGARDPWDLDYWTIYSCPGQGSLRRTVWVRPDQDVDDPMTVEAVPSLIHHAARGGSPAYTELRLCGARAVR
jgi:hypothetical protein